MIEAIFGGALGAFGVAFLVWAVRELRKRAALGATKRDELAHLDNMGTYWGLPRAPGEDPEVFRGRLLQHVRGTSRYPREPS